MPCFFGAASTDETGWVELAGANTNVFQGLLNIQQFQNVNKHENGHHILFDNTSDLVNSTYYFVRKYMKLSEELTTPLISIVLKDIYYQRRAITRLSLICAVPLPSAQLNDLLRLGIQS